MGSSSPIFGVKIKKYLSCHHLEKHRLQAFGELEKMLMAVRLLELQNPKTGKFEGSDFLKGGFFWHHIFDEKKIRDAFVGV